MYICILSLIFSASNRQGTSDEIFFVWRPQDIEMNSTRPLLRKAAFPLAGALLFGLIGLYSFSQSPMATSKADSINVDAANNKDIYKAANADEMNALPRLAILPFETIGDNASYGLMPDACQMFLKTNSTILSLR